MHKRRSTNQGSKILIIGADGTVGKSLYRHFLGLGYSVVGTSRRASSQFFVPFDLEYPDFSQIDLRQFSHAFICAAHCNLRQCEQAPQQAYRCNVRGTMLTVEKLCEHFVQPVLFSTDYVFDGTKGDYTETDLLNPLNEYGRQKVELEKAALNYPCVVFRLGKVYDTSLDPKGLLGEMVFKLRQGELIKAARDQIFSPLLIEDLNIAMQKVVDRPLTGLYQLGGPQAWTRYDIALAVAKCLGTSVEGVVPISLDDLGEPLKRPKNTSMNVKLWENVANQSLTSLSQALEVVKRMT